VKRLESSTRNNILFQGQSDSERRKLFDAMKRIVVNSGDTIIREGAAGDFFYVVLQGTFDVLRKEFGDKPLLQYTSGESFGELALMYNCPRAATVVSKTRGIIFRMDRHTFKQMVVGSNIGVTHVSELRNKYERTSMSMQHQHSNICKPNLNSPKRPSQSRVVKNSSPIARSLTSRTTQRSSLENPAMRQQQAARLNISTVYMII
jgi:cAMP-dependent protein kinase regulator